MIFTLSYFLKYFKHVKLLTFSLCVFIGDEIKHMYVLYKITACTLLLTFRADLRSMIEHSKFQYKLAKI